MNNEFYVGNKGDKKEPVNVTVSIGVSTTSVDTVNSANLHLQAYKALC
jgi:GGDEF domain-containing protein